MHTLNQTLANSVWFASASPVWCVHTHTHIRTHTHTHHTVVCSSRMCHSTLIAWLRAFSAVSCVHMACVVVHGSSHTQVREYVPPAESVELSAAQLETLKRDVETKRGNLETWCKTAFGEVGV